MWELESYAIQCASDTDHSHTYISKTLERRDTRLLVTQMNGPMISEAGTNAGEDKLKRKMVASGQVLPVGSTHTQRIKKIYYMLKGGKARSLC